MNKNQKQLISLEEFVFILVDLKFENGRLIKEFNDLSKEIEVGDNKLSGNHFLEYLIFDLFTDSACFLLAFSQEVSLILSKIYFPNILVRLIKKGYEINGGEFEDLFKKRAIEYHSYLQEYDPEYIKKIDINKYLPSLGKAFSINFVGYKSPSIILKAHVIFTSKLKHFYGKFLKNIVEKYEIVLQK